jgi:hypothetical protein
MENGLKEHEVVVSAPPNNSLNRSGGCLLFIILLSFNLE